MVLLLNAWAALLVTLALATLVLQLLGTMALLDVKLSAVPAVLLVLAIGRGVHFTVHLCLVSLDTCLNVGSLLFKLVLSLFMYLFWTTDFIIILVSSRHLSHRLDAGDDECPWR